MERVIKSVKPSGTYVQVRLLRPWKATENGREHIAGEVITCRMDLADRLAREMVGAIVTERPASSTRPMFPVLERVR